MLKNKWYLICPSDELENKIVKKKILGEDILLFRKDEGDIAALEDRCCHRNVNLSLGYINNNTIVCGYHGWQDWYIGSTERNKGVPEAVRQLSHSFTYNDLSSLEALFQEYNGEFAAVIMEPMNTEEPIHGFLKDVKELAHRNGALFILDEIITGFRYSLGGAQELFNITPDLATFGKSMANGFPISAVVGRKELMKEMEEVFFSFTFGPE